ncbi:unnamed protein product, partial [Effrenium voratum]
MLAGICARLLQIFLAVPVGWLADIYGIGLVTLATAIVQMCAGIPFFLALQSDPLSATNVFVTYAVGYGLLGLGGIVIFMYCGELFPTSVRNLGVGVSY